MKVFIVSKATQVDIEAYAYYDFTPVCVFINLDSAESFVKEMESKLDNDYSPYYEISDEVDLLV